MPPVRFLHADDTAIRAELRRHHVVLERRDEVAGESTVTCSCGATFGPAPDGGRVLDAWVEHFLERLREP